MKKVIVDETKCIRCGSCMSIAKDIFGYGEEGESIPLVDTVTDDNKEAIMAMESCPTGAITLENAEEKECSCDPCECEDCHCGDDCSCGEDCECHLE